MTPISIIVSIAVSLVALVGSAFAFGAMWSGKQDKSTCKEEHREMNEKENAKEKEFWLAINELRTGVSSMNVHMREVTIRLENIDTKFRLEEQIERLTVIVKEKLETARS